VSVEVRVKLEGSGIQNMGNGNSQSVMSSALHYSMEARNTEGFRCQLQLMCCTYLLTLPSILDMELESQDLKLIWISAYPGEGSIEV